jgi:2-polyprenyl-6-hydroxyphenyl methylase/3-demethylubiquinone-9 3-methyltransferase
MFSTYSHRFWEHRLEWFKAQSEAGLMGEIDYDRTCDGTIACADGFHSGALTEEELFELGHAVDLLPEVIEVDGSSLFGVWRLPGPSL